MKFIEVQEKDIDVRTCINLALVEQFFANPDSEETTDVMMTGERGDTLTIEETYNSFRTRVSKAMLGSTIIAAPNVE